MALESGLSNVTITHIETGQTNPPERTLRALAEALRNDFGESSLRKYVRETTRELRIEARVAAGAPIIRVDDETILVGSEFANLKGDVCALRVSGDSMVDDHILDGDILICRRTPEPRQDSIVVVDFKGEVGASVKRWRLKGDTVILSSNHYDKSSPKYTYPTWRLGKVFEVLGLIRRLH